MANLLTEALRSKEFRVIIVHEADIRQQAEIAKLRREVEQLAKNIASNQQRLEDKTFRSRAPEHIVKGLEKTLAERRAEFEKLKDRLRTLEKNVDP